MKTEIDRDLVKQVTNLLAERSEEKKRNFYFARGAQESALLISKKKIGTSDQAAAKKAAEATSVLKGLCYGKGGGGETKAIVFLVRRNQVDASLERKLKSAIKENAGLNCQVEVRAADDTLMQDGEVRGVDDRTADEVTVPKEATQEQKDLANKARYKKITELIAERVGLLQKFEPNKAAEFMTRGRPILERAQALVSRNLPEGERDYKKALEILLKFKSTVPTPDKKKPANWNKSHDDWLRFKDDAPTPDTTCLKDLNTAALLIKKLQERIGDHPCIEEARTTYRDGMNHFRRMEFDDARAQVGPLASGIQQILTLAKSCDGVMQMLESMQDPAFARAELDGFGDEFMTALNKPFAHVPANLKQTEDHLRQALGNRTRFVDTMKAVNALWDKAKPTLGDATANEIDADYWNALHTAETVGLSAGYDAMAQVDAKLRAATRKALDGIQQPKKLERTPETRRLDITLKVQQLRRSVARIARFNAGRAQPFQQALDKVMQTKDGNDLDQVETTLTGLTNLIQTAFQSLPQQPPPRLGARRPMIRAGNDEGTGGLSTQQWRQQIDQSNVMGRVTKGRELGSGGAGVVNVLDAPEGEDAPSLVIKTPTGIDAFNALDEERKLYEKVGDHPNLIKCLGMRNVGGEEGLVLERVQGKDVGAYMENLNAQFDNGDLSASEYWGTVKYSLKKTMEALVHLHDKGFAHNDLKPGNVMIDEKTGELKVIDLGTLNPLGARIEGSDNPSYRAPEDFRDKTSTPQTDAFGAGAAMYAAIYQKTTFHYGDEEGMEAGQGFHRERIIQAYGQQGGQAFPEDETQGQDFGNAALGQFKELMNRIMDPDPKTRLSPQQVLEHPFLSEALMSDDEVKAVIQRLGQPPLEE